VARAASTSARAASSVTRRRATSPKLMEGFIRRSTQPRPCPPRPRWLRQRSDAISEGLASSLHRGLLHRSGSCAGAVEASGRSTH
jgi:hypothetical protein